MLKLLSSNLWPEIETLAANAKRKQVAVAYVSDDLRIKFKSGDMLITDASDDRIASGNTSKKILTDAFQNKVKIYSLPNLHSKIFIFDDILVMGSTNISSSSRNRLYEAGIITDDPKLVADAKKLLEKYQKGAIKLNEPLIKKIMSIRIVIDHGNQSDRIDNVKPSLINLLRSRSYILDDFVISLYEKDATLTYKTIRQITKKKGIKLPSSERWVWYEDDYDKKIEKVFDRFFVKSELKVIGLEVLRGENRVIKFVDLDTDIQVYISKIKIRRKLVTNFVTDKRPPFKLNKRELLKELNNILKSNDKVGKKLIKSDLLTAQEFARILEIT